MVLPLLLALTLRAQSQSVSDYFPVAPGTKWTFSQDSEGVKDEVVYTALAPVKVGRQMAVAMQQSENGSDTTLFYHVDDQSLLFVAIDPKDPFVEPRPLIRLNTPSNKWRFDYTQQTEPINVDAELQRIGKRGVLGTERDVMMVILHVTMGNEGKLHITQTTYYAEGLGMYRMEMYQMLGNIHHSSTQTLIKFEPAKSK